MRSKMEKTYLGDAVYAEIENGMIKLTTSNGIRTGDTIFLEPAVYGALTQFVADVRALSEGEQG